MLTITALGNGVFTVWDLKDVETLRSHRVYGSMQENRLPLVLLPEEARFSVEELKLAIVGHEPFTISGEKRPLDQESSVILRDPKAMYSPVLAKADQSIVKLTCTLSLNASTSLLVYADLWNRGYTMSGGSKFGVDYLVYSGSPTEFHSIFLLTVMKCSQTLTAKDVIAIGRLATAVVKVPVIASVSTHGVSYVTIPWNSVLTAYPELVD